MIDNILGKIGFSAEEISYVTGKAEAPEGWDPEAVVSEKLETIKKVGLKTSIEELKKTHHAEATKAIGSNFLKKAQRAGYIEKDLADSYNDKIISVKEMFEIMDRAIESQKAAASKDATQAQKDAAEKVRAMLENVQKERDQLEENLKETMGQVEAEKRKFYVTQSLNKSTSGLEWALPEHSELYERDVHNWLSSNFKLDGDGGFEEDAIHPDGNKFFKTQREAANWYAENKKYLRKSNAGVKPTTGAGLNPEQAEELDPATIRMMDQYQNFREKQS